MRRFTLRAVPWAGVALFAATLALYTATLAPGLVFGDPAEYTFVPHIWGIMHPPGYAMQTVLGGIWQRIIPLGSIAYRANLLSAMAGAAIAALVYGSVRALTPRDAPAMAQYAPGLLAGLSAATATDIWQHSIHANAHIITALLATANLFLLLRWSRGGADGAYDARWLYAFCVVAGLSVTHHPLLIFSFPAYTAFILVTKPGVLADWKTLLKMTGFALIGLSVWLYLPIRASLPAPVPFGPDNTNTLDGFLDLVLARGLRVNLFYFGLKDQAARWLVVFPSLLRLQASPPVIALMVAGLVWLWACRWRTGLLFTAFLLVNLAFILNSIQDVMAYLMVPFTALMTLAGAGLIPVFERVRLPAERDTHALHALLALVVIGMPVLRAVILAPLVSLRHYREADNWIEEVYTQFEGKGEGAILLAHWEHLTPLWYAAWVEDRPLDEKDLRLVYVATTSERPWVDNTWANIDAGPVYVSGYQRELINEGFRLRPVGRRLYRVMPPPAVQKPDMPVRLDARAGPVAVLGVDLPLRDVVPGQVIPLSIALTAEEPPADIIFPYTTLGDPVSSIAPVITFNYTTDNHWLTPCWEPGETIVERYDVRVPLDATPGEYPLRLGLRNLSQGGQDVRFEDGSTSLELGTIRIQDAARNAYFLPEEGLMANIAQRVGLVGALARANGQRRVAVWQEPLIVRPGDDIRVRLTWTALYPPDDNWKVFVHLIDGGNHVIAQQDAPPLGGAFPTFLWFPKWVPGQTVVDPYRLTVPPGTPPGDYMIEVGMYGFMTSQRAPFFDEAGNLSGDRFILGMVRVEE